MTRRYLLVTFLAACAISTAAPAQSAIAAPRVDYHQHFVSPAFQPIVSLAPRDGRRLLAMLDSAGVEKAVVLSVAYSFADERKTLTNPDSLSRAENDWTSAQVRASGGRLIGFCSANPLRPAGLGEIERCHGLPGMTGVKLHFGNSGITLRDTTSPHLWRDVFVRSVRSASCTGLTSCRRAAAFARAGKSFGTRFR